MSNEKVPEGYNLTDDDLINMQKKLMTIDSKILENIYNTFKQAINGILNLAYEQAKSRKDTDDIVTIEQLKRVIGFAPADEVFLRCKEKIWGHRNQILEKNARYFIEKDYSALIKRDHNQIFMESLVTVVRTNFTELSEKQQDFYWKKAAQLLSIVAKFKKIAGEYKD